MPGHGLIANASFFVIRTPLLPLDDFLEWSGVADRERLRESLATFIQRAEVWEALSLASPNLIERFPDWLRDPESKRGRKIEHSLVRYFTRMTARATPFGLCAGYSVGRIGGATNLTIGARETYRRATRLDASVIAARDAEAMKAQRRTLRYRPTSSLFRAGGRVRYVTARGESYHSVVLDPSEYIDATLERARDGATLDGLAAPLADDDVTRDEAEAFIRELIDDGVLIADFGTPLTGAAQLGAIGETDAVHIDLMKPAPAATLGDAVLAEIRRGVALLHRITPTHPFEAFRRFKEAFAARYEAREVPLAEALDEELGIGFGESEETSPLLKDLQIDATPPPVVTDRKRDAVLMRKVHDALQHGTNEIALDAKDIEALAAGERLPLPDAFSVSAILASSPDGGFRVVVQGCTGPSGAIFLGRFCESDETLRANVELHLREEEALHPEAVFAEVVHMPEPNAANVISRPRLREYEIVYLGRAGAPLDKQIGIDDLRVSIRDGRIRLRSARLDREVIPRITNAHNYRDRGAALYRFLGMLQQDGVAGRLGWDWGALQAAPYLPRVTAGRVVLSLARWTASKDELRALTGFREALEWRTKRNLPRFVSLMDGDAGLLVDFENVLSVESFVQMVHERDEALLIELYPGPDELCATGPEGTFIHELIVPFIRPATDSHSRTERRLSSIGQMQRRFAPGSEWLYVKLYAGPAACDDVLRRLAPLARFADQWFFIRYSDPDHHVRVRFRGDSKRLERRLHRTTAALLDDGLVWRMQLDTYEREVERYGGDDGALLAERIFHVDSDAVVEILEMLEPGDEGLDERWQLALAGVDLLLTDFGLDTLTKRELVRSTRGDSATLHRQMAANFRESRETLELLLDAGDDHPLAPGLEVLRTRSARLRPIAAELQQLDHEGRLAIPLRQLIPSYTHMHVNRLLRSAQLQQERVIYDYLARLYDARLSR